MRREKTSLLFFLLARAYALVYGDLCLGCLRASVTHGLTLQRKIRDCLQPAELKVRVSTDIILQYNLA